MANLLFIGGLGTGELCVIVLVLLLLFGGTKLPELMRGAGRGIKEFKDAMNDSVLEPSKGQESDTVDKQE
ncbi:MAG: twin-arginine translocase TatA/TatE family subunit [Rikenellaceae bacterium]